MKTLAERHKDRIIRKGEHAIAEGMKFDTSRGGIGKPDPLYTPDADAMNEAIDTAIERTARVIGAMPIGHTPEPMFSPAAVKMVKVSGI